ncbi:hypothetical protein J3F83DRAFT_751677 [Trichoderma novae-zelandiae]
MRDPKSPKGRVYRFKPSNQWDRATRYHCHVPNAVRKHMVVVVGESPTIGNWLVVTITTTRSPGIDGNLFVPIAPMPRHPVTKMQLHLADDPYGDRGLPVRSYLRVNRVYQVPEEALVEQRSYGRDLELRQGSYDGLIGFMRNRELL